MRPFQVKIWKMSPKVLYKDFNDEGFSIVVGVTVGEGSVDSTAVIHSRRSTPCRPTCSG